METLLNRISKAISGLSGGVTKLLSYEQTCLDAWRVSLSETDKRVLDAQLAAVPLVQRQAAGAKLCFYYPEGKDIPLFENVQPDLHVATILLRADGGSKDQTMRVKIFVHRGKFFSIEFPKRPERYMQLHHMQTDKLQVAAVETHM